MQNLTVQKLCLVLITLASFVFAPWITSQTLEGNSMPLLLIGSVVLLLLFVYGLGDRCWWIIPFCLPIEGNLNFLPLNFSLQELAIVTVFSYLLFRMIFGLDVGLRLGPVIFWAPLLGVLAVILYHWISSGDIGIKLLGGTGWGGRKYFKVLIASLCLPLLASFPQMRWQDLQKVPLIYFLGSLVDIVPDTLTTLLPASAPFVYRIYSGVNLSEYGALVQGAFGSEVAVTRIRNLGTIGTAIGLLVLCYCPAHTWLSPNRLWALPLVLVGGLLCALSGFRNSVFRYFLSLLAGLYATLRWKAVVVLPLVLTAAVTVSLTQGKIFDYPLALQRGLAFLPGDWNPVAKGSADDSSKWRKQITELFFREYFQKNPLLGLGYHFDPDLAKREVDVYLAVVQQRAEIGDEYADARRYIEMRQPHEGPVHILLVSGVVGSFFFVLFCGSLLLYSFWCISQTAPKMVTPLQIWSAALLLPQVLGFFMVFGDLTNFLIAVVPIAALFYRGEQLRQEPAVRENCLAEPASLHKDPQTRITIL